MFVFVMIVGKIEVCGLGIVDMLYVGEIFVVLIVVFGELVVCLFELGYVWNMLGVDVLLIVFDG